MHLQASLVTLLAILVLGYAGYLVGRARGRYAVAAPATTGHPDFERVFRAQMNTIEQFVAFLPALWLATALFDPLYAAIAGYVWLVGRLWYIVGYAADAKKRAPGFLIGSLALLALLGMAGWGLARGFMAG